MDPMTGKIVEMTYEKQNAEQERRAKDGEAQLVRLKQKAREDCYKCNGTGHRERNVRTGLYRACPCTFETNAERAKHEEFKKKKEEKQMTGPGGEEDYGSAQNH